MKVKRMAKAFGIVFGILFILIQFVQPNRENPPVDPAQTMQAEINVPPNIASLLQRGCIDCHSNQTRWPWYAYVAPVSWLTSYDVREGRKHFNMSEWGKYKFSKKVNILGGINSVVKEKEMPLPKYILLHPEADFSDAERDTLSSWARSAAEAFMGAEED
ncbi:MAG: heme-binding domain-containing protein [Bacteroidota bacterium]